jgi:hypothetical protein
MTAHIHRERDESEVAAALRSAGIDPSPDDIAIITSAWTELMLRIQTLHELLESQKRVP